MVQIKDSHGRNTGSKLQHLQSVARQTRKTPKELQLPEVDSSMLHLIDYYYDIKKQRGEKITYTELKSFQQLMNISLSAWQVECIMNIDSIYEGVNHG